MIIKYPKKIDLTEFKKDHTNVTKYGLPSDIKYCKKCVISNQRPNTTIEFKHTSKSKKQQSILMMKEYVTLALSQRRKIKI